MQEVGNSFDRSAVVFIEFQREWLNEDGKVRPFVQDRSQFDAAVDNATKVLAAARQTSIPIVHVSYSFTDGHPELGTARYGLREIMREGKMVTGKGAEFFSAFAPRSNEFVASGRFGVSAFAGSNLDSYLRNNNINKLYLLGFALQTCVESTLRDSHDRSFEAIVVEDATAAFTAEQRNYVLGSVVPIFGRRITTDALVDELNQNKSIQNQIKNMGKNDL